MLSQIMQRREKRCPFFLLKRYSPTGRRNHGRPLKRLLDTWDRNGSTSGPTPWQIHDDDDDDDFLSSLIPVLSSFYLPYPSHHSSRSSFILTHCHHLFISFSLYSNFLSLCEPLLLPLIFSFFSLLPKVPLTHSFLVSEFFTLTALTFFSYKLTNAYLDVYSSM